MYFILLSQQNFVDAIQLPTYTEVIVFSDTYFMM